MGYSVQGRIEVSVYINDVEFPLDTFNTLNYLHIAWWTRGILPTFRLGVFDARHTLDTVELQDGIPIRIVVKPLQSATMVFNFRKFNHRKVATQTGFTYEMDGYLNYPKYWIGTSVAGIRGTSNDVLSQIASTCGMNFIGTNTNDSQLWLPRNRTYGEFANQIKKRGYVSDTSYMELGVNPNGTMLYQDVTQLGNPTATVVLGEYVQGSFTAADYLPKAKSGMPNKMTGYQHSRYDQTAIGAQNTPQSSSIDTIDFTPDSNSPLFNASVKTAIGRGYQTFGGIDVGNTHENYEQAIYQNMRIANLYSLDVEFLMQSPTNLNIFDSFTFSVNQEASKADIAYAGAYIVVGRTILVTGAQYAEKILGTRQGTNLAYTGG